MPEGKGARREAERLAEDAAKTQAWSRDLMAELVQAARMCAVTEDKVAETLDHLAETQPREAARLRAKSAFAREQAARERQWAKDHEPADRQHD